MNLSPAPDETLDLFLEGRLQVLQQKKGYRVSVDTILLSQFIHLRENEKAADFGTGCGILPLILSLTSKARSFVGIEIQKGLADLARRNIALNQLECRVSIVQRNVKELKEVFSPGSFDVVFSNPPYRQYHSGRINPSPEKAIARHEIETTLHDLIETATYLLPAKGRCYLVYPASRAIDLLVTLRHCRLEPKRLRFVHSGKGKKAEFILAESVKHSGTELKVMEPLFLESGKDLLTRSRESINNSM